MPPSHASPTQTERERHRKEDGWDWTMETEMCMCVCVFMRMISEVLGWMRKWWMSRNGKTPHAESSGCAINSCTQGSL